MSTRRHSMEKVLGFVKENSECRLLSDKYKNQDTKMEFLCSCGNIFTTTFAKFKFRDKRQCNECGDKIRTQKRLLPIEEVRDICKENGYKPLFKNYKGYHEKILVETKEGYKVNVLLSNIISSKNINIFNKSNKYTIDNIKHYIDINGISTKLLSTKYTTNRDKLVFQCDCGEIFERSLNHFKDRERYICYDCSVKQRADNQRWDTKIFKNKVKELYGDDYKVLGKYITARTRIKVKHTVCDTEYYVQPHSLLRGNECRRCYFSNNVGSNHPMYKPSKTDEERLLKRYQLYGVNMQNWRTKVYERDSYTCQICRTTESGVFNAHHLNSWDWAKDERFCIDNGITLCSECHKDFHKTYGYGNNTKNQFIEYKNKLKKTS